MKSTYSRDGMPTKLKEIEKRWVETLTTQRNWDNVYKDIPYLLATIRRMKGALEGCYEAFESYTGENFYGSPLEKSIKEALSEVEDA